jgi:Tfp pilus assembly major pilin PilA
MLIPGSVRGKLYNMIDIPATVIESLWALVIAAIAAVIAYLENQKKNDVIKAFDVTSTQSSDPELVASLPERTWKMSESTKQWITFDATPENKAAILAQVDAAEAEHKTKYQINFTGGYYLIEYGLQYGGSGNPSGN